MEEKTVTLSTSVSIDRKRCGESCQYYARFSRICRLFCEDLSVVEVKGGKDESVYRCQQCIDSEVK